MKCLHFAYVVIMKLNSIFVFCVCACFICLYYISIEKFANNNDDNNHHSEIKLKKKEKEMKKSRL